MRTLPCALLTVAACATSRTFDVTHELTVPVPDGAKQVRVWFTRPQSDPAQRIRSFKVDAPAAHRTATDSEGNTYLYFQVDDPATKEFRVTNTFQVTRKEVHVAADPARTRPHTKAELASMDHYLQPNENVVMDERMKKLARDIVGGETNPVRASRRIYDWELENIDYWVKDPEHKKASPVGSAEYCLDSRTGNCTDFHSLYLSLSRCAGIPARITYGSLLKGPLDGEDQDQSYHCWIEFHAPGIGWVPLDVAVADIFVGDFPLNDGNRSKVNLTVADGYHGADPAMVDYYFGSLDARRVTWTRGRDLVLDPKPANGPVNAMAKAHVEIDGKPGKYDRKLTYREIR